VVVLSCGMYKYISNYIYDLPLCFPFLSFLHFRLFSHPSVVNRSLRYVNKEGDGSRLEITWDTQALERGEFDGECFRRWVLCTHFGKAIDARSRLGV
jgi:hypothetical protein